MAEGKTVMSDRSNPTRSVLAAGYAPLDIVTYAGRLWHAAGGTAGNVAAILGFLGWDSSLVADYGDDLAGQRARRDLQAANVSVHLVRSLAGHATPRLVHEIDGGGHRYRFRCPACLVRFPHSRPLRIDRAAEIVESEPAPDVYFFDRLNAGTLLLAEHFAETGSLIVFEPSRPVRADLTARAIKAAHVVKQSDDRETGLDSVPPSRNQLWVVTGGANGTRFRLGAGRWHHSPAFSYPVVDAGGAGDWTTAGLIHALPLVDRRTVGQVSDALAWAQALAAVSCGSPGARGLARSQSADAVVRAARFLQQSESDLIAPSLASGPVSSAPRSVCSYCLMPRAATQSSSTAAGH